MNRPRLQGTQDLERELKLWTCTTGPGGLGKGHDIEERAPLATWEVASSWACSWALKHGENLDKGKGRPHSRVGRLSLAE